MNTLFALSVAALLVSPFPSGGFPGGAQPAQVDAHKGKNPDGGKKKGGEEDEEENRFAVEQPVPTTRAC